MYVLKFSRRKNAMISSWADSRLWLFKSVNVPETDCLSIIMGLNATGHTGYTEYTSVPGRGSWKDAGQ